MEVKELHEVKGGVKRKTGPFGVVGLHGGGGRGEGGRQCQNQFLSQPSVYFLL